MLIGTINPKSGDFEWFGKVDTAEARMKIGTLLEKPNFYDYLSATDNLKIVADIRNVDHKMVDTALQLVDLYDRRKSKFKTFSLGMKQRLAIASALLGDPNVLILDEPTNGLDPTGIAEVRDLIKELAKNGKTIILASHLLDEVQKVCTDLLVMKNGKKIFEGSIDNLSKSDAIIELDSDNNKLLVDLLIDHNSISEIKREGDLVVAKLLNELETSELNSFLHKKGVSLNHLLLRKANLEKQVLELLKSN